MLIGTVAIVLAGHVIDLRDRALAPEPPGWTPTAVPLERMGVRNGVEVQRLRLYAAAPDIVLKTPEIDILFATWGREVRLVRGSLDLAGCHYAVPAGERVRNNALLRFIREAHCVPPSEPSDEMVLTMRVPAGAPLAVWAFTPSAPARGGELIFVGERGSTASAVPVLRGRYVDWREASRVRRVHLLAYVWQIAGTPYWIGAVLAIAGVLFVIGGALFPPSSFPSSAHGVLRPAAGAACLALSLGLLYAVLIPPFEAPDEPDHFLEFARATGRPELAEQAADLSRVGHLERIKFRNLERFRPADVGQPFAQAWDPEIFPMGVATRSRTTQILWRTISILTPARSAPAMLLLLRVIDAMLFALALGVGVALLGVFRAAPSAASIFLLIPTLPFFAVHVSEFAVLTSTYVVFACVVAALFMDGPRAHWLGAPLGLCCALMLAGGRSTVPMLAVVAAALVGRALLGTRGTPNTSVDVWRRAAIFWIGAAAGATALILFSTDDFRRGIFPGEAPQIRGWRRWAAQVLRQQPWVITVVTPAGLLVETLIAAVRSRIRTTERTTARISKTLAYAGATVLLSLAIGSLFTELPMLAMFKPEAPPPVARYVADALAVFCTSFRLRSPDFLLATSFWGGFGWLDTILPLAFVSSLVGLSGGAAVVLLFWIGRSHEIRKVALIAVLTGGWLGAVALYAVSTLSLYRNLHGRYLVGLYLSILAVIWTVTSAVRYADPRGRLAKLSRLAPMLFLAGSAAVHACALAIVLRRYF